MRRVWAPTYKNYLLLAPAVVTVTSSLSSVASETDRCRVDREESVLLTLATRWARRWLALVWPEWRWLTRNVSRSVSESEYSESDAPLASWLSEQDGVCSKVWLQIVCQLGDMVRLKDERLLKRSATKKQGSSVKWGRPQLRWEDCVKSDQRKAEEEETWSEKANDKGRW